MNTSRIQSKLSCAQSAFTLAEVMIASALLVMLTGAIVYTFLFGLHLRKTAEVKLAGSDDARKVLVTLTDEIRAASRVQIGTVSGTNFTERATNAVQTGPAVQIYSNGNTNAWVRYYCATDPKATNYSRLLRRTSTDTGTNFTVVIAHSLINTTNAFSAEDRKGNPLSNHDNNRVIGVNFQFYQVEDTLIKVANVQKHDFFQLRTRITRRRVY